MPSRVKPHQNVTQMLRLSSAAWRPLITGQELLFYSSDISFSCLSNLNCRNNHWTFSILLNESQYQTKSIEVLLTLWLIMNTYKISVEDHNTTSSVIIGIQYVITLNYGCDETSNLSYELLWTRWGCFIVSKEFSLKMQSEQLKLLTNEV